jgi:hypothetical protein
MESVPYHATHCGLDAVLFRTPFQIASIRLPVTVASGSVNWYPPDTIVAARPTPRRT